MNSPSDWMRQAIELAVGNVDRGGGGPFGAVVVCNGTLVGSGANAVTALNDPTAHAEIVAIREACRTLGSFQLEGCEIYSSCEPCPMCLGAIYWARIAKVYFACSSKDAALAGFDDTYIYEEIKLTPAQRAIPREQILTEGGGEAFRVWRDAIGKILY